MPESVDEASCRLARERPHPIRPLTEVAAAGLAELRALCQLADHLHRPRP